MVSRASKRIWWLGAGLLLVVALPAWGQAVGTPILEAPLKLAWPAGMPALSKPLMPSVADWNADGVAEVLCSEGTGKLWLLAIKVTATAAQVTAAEPVLAAGSALQTSQSAKPNFVDFTGDGRPDLVIEDMATRTLRVYPNVGSRQKPELGAFQCARSGGVPVLGAPAANGDGVLHLSERAHGRVAVADWDGDARPDIVYGKWEGELVLLRNEGTPTKPLFPGEEQQLSWNKLYPRPVCEAYGPYPCVKDFNGDGAVDLSYGLNWGCILFYLNGAPTGKPVLVERVQARQPDAAYWDAHTVVGAYVMPDYADFDGDATLDAVFSGSQSTDLYVSRGSRGPLPLLEELDGLLAGGAEAASERLAQDARVRQTLLTDQVLLYHYGTWTAGPGRARAELLERLLAHCRDHPFLYGDHAVPPSAYPGVPWAVAQARATLRELAGRDPALFARIAEALQLAPLRASVLRDAGVMLWDNSGFREPQLQFLHALLTAIPSGIIHLQGISSADDLGPRPPSPDVQLDCVNVYGGGDITAAVGNSFGAELAYDSADWCACVAHEVNHAVDAYSLGRDRALSDRKIRLLEAAAPPEVVFTYKDRDYSHRDWEATKARFRAKGLWNGVDGDWPKAWESYWKDGPGAPYNENFLRDNLGFFIEAPQEAFATLANQYFASSDAMYQLACLRWQKGRHQPINQFLYFVDVYSQGTNTSRVYQTDAKGTFQWHEAKLSRDAAGHINGMQIGGAWHDFTLDAQGYVTEIH